MGQQESSQAQEQVVKGTITPVDPFFPEKDAEALNAAMEGLGTDEDAISKILTKRSNKQRQGIAAAFKEKFKTSLADSLKSELSFNYKETVLAMVEEPTVMMARFINKLAKGVFPNRDRTVDLLEIIFPLHPHEIMAIGVAYKETFGTEMAADITAAAEGPFKEILISIVTGNRDDSVTPDQSFVEKDAKFFQLTSPDKFQLPNDQVQAFFGRSSVAFLRATIMRTDQLLKSDNKTFEDHIQSSKMDACQKTGFLVMAKCVCQPIEYYAQCLYDSMKGLGTADDKLIRIIVSRSEIDLANIKTVFKQNYKVTLADMVTGDTSGDYMRILLEIIGK